MLRALHDQGQKWSKRDDTCTISCKTYMNFNECIASSLRSHMRAVVGSSTHHTGSSRSPGLYLCKGQGYEVPKIIMLLVLVKEVPVVR